MKERNLSRLMLIAASRLAISIQFTSALSSAFHVRLAARPLCRTFNFIISFYFATVEVESFDQNWR